MEPAIHGHIHLNYIFLFVPGVFSDDMPLLCFSLFLHLMICYAYENLAFNKSTYMQTTYLYNPGDTTFDASNAVDGRKTDLSAFGGQCAISTNSQRSATWWVNLGSIQSIHHITIYFRTDNKAGDISSGFLSRVLGFSLYVSNTPNRSEGDLCFKDTFYTKETVPMVFSLSCLKHGQYIIFYNERLNGVSYPDEYSADAFSDLCEVEVYGCPTPGYYGYNCSKPCPDPENCRYCNIETGTCLPGNPRCSSEENAEDRFVITLASVLIVSFVLIVTAAICCFFYKTNTRGRTTTDTHHSHHEYTLDSDQAPYEEHSPDISRPNVLEINLHHGRASGFEQADDQEQAQQEEFAHTLESSSDILLEVLTACNVNTAPYAELAHSDVNNTSDIEHARYEEIAADVVPDLKSVSDDSTSCNIHSTLHNGPDADPGLSIDSKQGLYEDIIINPVSNSEPVSRDRTDEATDGDGYIPPVSANALDPVAKEETSNELVSEEEQAPDVYHRYENLIFYNSQRRNKDGHQ